MNSGTITFKWDSPFWLGDHFFRVEPPKGVHTSSRSEMVFRTKCPSCNDSRKITYTGADGKEYAAECPLCKVASYSNRAYGNELRLTNWEVHEYIVNKLETNGPYTVTSYKGCVPDMESIRFTAFYRYGRGMDDYVDGNVPLNKECIDPPLTMQDAEDKIANRNRGEAVFRSRKNAEAFCSMLKEVDRQRLAHFNEVYGTSYEYPF